MRATVCQYCGSRRVALDPVSGTLVCQECGAVISEDLIDDELRLTMHDTTRNARSLFNRENKKITRLDIDPNLIYKASKNNKIIVKTDRSYAIVPLSYKIAQRSVDEKILGLAHEIRSIVARSRPPRILTKKTSIALALYVSFRASGWSKRRSLVEASKKTRTSLARLETLEREYRSQLDTLIGRVQTEWLGKRRKQ